MKILHTADWHLGTFRSPVKDGVNLRTEDTKRCLDELIRVANEEKPDYSLVSGDIFHVGRLWSDRCCEEIITAIHYIRELAAVSKQVVVMRGTPNHDGSGQFNVLSEMFADVPNVHVVITPQVISFDDVDIAVLPGFDRGVFRANHPGLSSDEENVVFTNELFAIMDELTLSVVKNLGWSRLCQSENPTAERANFREAYMRKAAETQNTNSLPDFVAQNKALLQQHYVPAIEKKEVPKMAELQDSATDINPTGKNVAFMYTKDPEKFSLEIPLPFYQYPLQVQKLETEIPCETRTAGLIIYYPLSMLLAYGI